MHMQQAVAVPRSSLYRRVAVNNSFAPSLLAVNFVTPGVCFKIAISTAFCSTQLSSALLLVACF